MLDIAPAMARDGFDARKAAVETKYYVYAYFDGEEPIYIGSGCGNRAYRHLTVSDRQRRQRRQSGGIQALHDRLWEMKLQQPPRTGKVNLLITGLLENEAAMYESSFIKFIGRADLGTGTLCNHSDGEWSKGVGP